jgi:membrane-bound metal-dependent hydrolase YbcI (DUF457 family)
MLKTSHVAIGAMAALMIQHSPTVGTALLLAGSALGSTLPDFDIKLNIPHRTITHWLLWPALVYFYFGLWPFAFGLSLGWALHIAADCLTVGGLRPLWPVRWHLRGPIKTGTLSEFLFIVPTLGLMIYSLTNFSNIYYH